MRLREKAARALAAAEGFVLSPSAEVEPQAQPAAPPSPPVIAATSVGAAGGAAALAAAVGVCAANGRAPLLVELSGRRPGRSATLLASAAARELEDELRRREPAMERAVARGYLCHASLPPAPQSLALAAAAIEDAGAGLVAVVVPGALWPQALDDERLGVCAGLIRADLPADRSLVALAVADLGRRGLRARVASRPLGRVASRRALAGAEPSGAAARRVRRLARGLLGERGQSLVAVAAAIAAIMFAALVMATIGGAVTGKGRAQRAADLAAISAARSMRDDLGRLLSPARRADGSPNARHLGKPAYLARAVRAGRHAARRNGVRRSRVRITFPDRGSFAPVRVNARVIGRIAARDLPGGGRRRRPIAVTARAVAEISAPLGLGGMPAYASGGGYSGPLAYRQGEPMRPDVAAAFDRMALAARAAGVALLVNSAFRSDAEQARLFAANPDPRWVAPPGRSLHRCATELDLGPPGAYSWLAAHARRFGFVQRYSWEPWHFGYTRGPAPCSAAANAGRGGDGRLAGAGGLPAFVPGRYRSAILRSAARWNVSAALISAQLMAESNFNPYASSGAGAQGIAQFIPATAHAYGLRNPFDPFAAIDAQSHLMADLLRRFRSIPLALAAYNAGPGAVAGCRCVPPYPETRAYVARILALLGGALLTPQLEVRLVA